MCKKEIICTPLWQAKAADAKLNMIDMGGKSMSINIDISKVVIKTDRLILRSWQESDIDDFFEYASVDGVGETAGWKHHETIAVSRKILNDFVSEKNVFAMVFKETNRVVGSLGLHRS